MLAKNLMILAMLGALCFAAGCDSPKPKDPQQVDRVTEAGGEKTDANVVNVRLMTRFDVYGSDFTGTCGKPDGSSFLMSNNGSIRAIDLWFAGGINELSLKAHGTPAEGVWPNIKLRLINTKQARSYDIVTDFVIDSATPKQFDIPLPEVLPIGNYIAEIFYTNNSDGIPPHSKEDRNVYIDTLMFNPRAPEKKTEGADVSTTAAAAANNRLLKLGKDFKCDAGKPDGDSMKMLFNGKATAEDLYTTASIRALEFVAHGTPAVSIWPMVQVRLAHTKSGMLVTVFETLSIDSDTPKTFSKVFDPPLEGGNYNVEFIYLNNSTGIAEGSKEDRNVNIDHVELKAVDYGQ